MRFGEHSARSIEMVLKCAVCTFLNLIELKILLENAYKQRLIPSLTIRMNWKCAFGQRTAFEVHLKSI